MLDIIFYFLGLAVGNFYGIILMVDGEFRELRFILLGCLVLFPGDFDFYLDGRCYFEGDLCFWLDESLFPEPLRFFSWRFLSFGLSLPIDESSIAVGWNMDDLYFNTLILLNYSLIDVL